MRRLGGLVPVLTKLRCASTDDGRRAPSDDSKTKIDKTIDRLRYVFAKHVKAGKRMDQLLTPANTSAPPADEVTTLAKVALDCLAQHAEQVLATTSPAVVGKSRTYLATTTVDTLLLLAYSSLIVDDRSTAAPCLTFLERCLPIIGFSPSAILALDLHYSIRTLTSAFYNIGGTLFNAGRPEVASKFVQRACDLSAQVLDQARTDGLLRATGQADHIELSLDFEKLQLADGDEGKEEKELRDALQDFERLTSRRWELLATTQYAIGDKKVCRAGDIRCAGADEEPLPQAAFDAYVAAVHSQPPSVLASLATASSQRPLSDLLSTHIPLYKQIERLTRLGTFDLLIQPALVALGAHPSLAPTPSRDVRGILLEMQLAVLEAQAESQEGRAAAAALLDQLLGLYDADKTPIRRARVLVKKLQLSCGGHEKDSETSVRALADEIAGLCAKEVRKLIQSRNRRRLISVSVLMQDFQDDASLRPFASQYIALSHLFLAFRLQAVRTASAETSDAVAFKARQALHTLRSMLEGTSTHAAKRPSTSPRLSRQTAASSPAKPASPPEPTPAPARRRPTRTGAATATPARSRLGRSQRGAATASTSPQLTPPRRTSATMDLRESTRTPAPKQRLASSGVVKAVCLDDVDSVFKSFGEHRFTDQQSLSFSLSLMQIRWLPCSASWGNLCSRSATSSFCGSSQMSSRRETAVRLMVYLFLKRRSLLLRNSLRGHVRRPRTGIHSSRQVDPSGARPGTSGKSRTRSRQR